MSAEQKLLEALEALAHAERDGRARLRPSYKTEIRDLFRSFQPTLERHGLHRLHWKTGGSSLAAVGGLSDGTLWYAPTNWTGDYPDAVASINWYAVEHATPLVVRPCEHGRFDDDCLGCAMARDGEARR